MTGSNENYQVTRGAGVRLAVTIRDQAGNPITAYDGSQALTTTVWPGGTRAASFDAATTWTDPAQGAISIVMEGADTAALAPGRYQFLTRLDDAGTAVDAYGATLDVLPFAGTDPDPKVYTTYDDLLEYGRSWLRQLQSDDDQAGFARQQARARTWIEGCGHNHFRVASMAMVVGGQALGPRRSGARSTWLQDQFDAGSLMITDEIRECVAKKALAYVCEGQVGTGDSAGQYGRLAKVYHGQADYLATTITLSLDTNADGFPDVNLDLSCTDPFYG